MEEKLKTQISEVDSNLRRRAWGVISVPVLFARG